MADAAPTTTWHVDAPLTDVPPAVDLTIQEFLADRHAEFDGIDPVIEQGISELGRFVVGGKRLRPLFAWAGVRAALDGGGGRLDPGTDAASLVRAVSSLEFIQACALIHDDIIDHSDTRRGRPTVHRSFEARHRRDAWLGDPGAYGVSQAILVGDLAFAWADDMLADSGVSAEALLRARTPWRAMRTEVIAGQMLDISVEASGSEDPGAPAKVNAYKTAAYTVERPLHVGAALADAPAHTVEMLRSAGRDIGVAFQLEDDYLGVFGDPAVTGKASGDDLRSGKRTYLAATALRAADATDPAAAARLRAGIGTVTSEEEVDVLRGIIVDSGAAADSTALIRSLTDRAVETLRGGGLGRSVTEELVAVAEELTERRS